MERRAERHVCVFLQTTPYLMYIGPFIILIVEE